MGLPHTIYLASKTCHTFTSHFDHTSLDKNVVYTSNSYPPNCGVANNYVFTVSIYHKTHLCIVSTDMATSIRAVIIVSLLRAPTLHGSGQVKSPSGEVEILPNIEHAVAPVVGLNGSGAIVGPCASVCKSLSNSCKDIAVALCR